VQSFVSRHHVSTVRIVNIDMDAWIIGHLYTNLGFTIYSHCLRELALNDSTYHYSLFKSERLSAHIKLTLHRALLRSVMTYARPAWEFAADIHLLKLKRLQNRVLRTIGNFTRHIG
jgi:hypothetical protein